MTYSVLEMMKLAEEEEGEKKTPFLIRYATPIGFLAGTATGALLGRRQGAKDAPIVHGDVIRILSHHPKANFKNMPTLDETRRIATRVESIFGGLAGGAAGALTGSLAKRHYTKKREKEKTASVLDAVVVGPEKLAYQMEEQKRPSRTKKLLIGLGGTAALGAGAYGLSRTKVGQQISAAAREKGDWLLTKTKDLGIAGREKGKSLITKIRNFG